MRNTWTISRKKEDTIPSMSGARGLVNACYPSNMHKRRADGPAVADFMHYSTETREGSPSAEASIMEISAIQIVRRANPVSAFEIYMQRTLHNPYGRKREPKSPLTCILRLEIALVNILWPIRTRGMPVLLSNSILRVSWLRPCSEESRSPGLSFA